MSTDHTAQPDTDRDTLQAVTDAAAWVVTVPPRRNAAEAYLRQRGIDPTGLDPAWIIGYALPGWTRLVDKLRGQFGDRALLDAGLARRSSRGTLIDTFRDRVIVGIRRPDGMLAGFIGRDLSGNPNAPKYLNTPRHPLFDKSSLLYGLHEGVANPTARQPVIVEGPLDVLAIASRQQRQGDSALLPVAPCGTAFTPTHAQSVAAVAFSHQAPVVVAMDGDAAGRLAALAAGEHLRRIGLDVRVAQLPNGSDPAEYLARTDATLDTFRADAGLPLLTARVQNIVATIGDDMQWIEGRLAALRTIAAYLATYPSSYTARQVGWLAQALELAPSTITDELVEGYRSAHSDRRRLMPTPSEFPLPTHDVAV